MIIFLEWRTYLVIIGIFLYYSFMIIIIIIIIILYFEHKTTISMILIKFS